MNKAGVIAPSSGSASGVGVRLLEGRQYHRSARALQRFGEVAIGSRVRRRGEIDVERDILHAGLLKLPEQLSIERARPGPDANLVDRRRVDRDNHDIAARLARLPGEAEVCQIVAKSAVPAAEHDDCQNNRHE